MELFELLQDGSTMLIEAAKGGHFDIMNLLLDWPTSGERGSASGGTNIGQTSSQPSRTDQAIKVSCGIFGSVSYELEHYSMKSWNQLKYQSIN